MNRKIYAFAAVFLAAFFIASGVFAGSQQTSSTTGATVITRARYMLNESTASFWTDAEMLVWINDGVVDIVSRTHCLEDIEQETLVENQMAYPLGDNYIAVKAVIFNNSSSDKVALIQGNLRSIGHVTSSATGEPVYWTYWEDSVYIYPMPSSTEAGDTIDVFVVKRPTLLSSSSDSVPTPAHYDRAVVLYVVIQALKKDRQFDRAMTLYMEYLSELDRYRQDFNEIPKTNELMR